MFLKEGARNWRTNENTNGVGLHLILPATNINYYKQVEACYSLYDRTHMTSANSHPSIGCFHIWQTRHHACVIQWFSRISHKSKLKTCDEISSTWLAETGNSQLQSTSARFSAEDNPIRQADWLNLILCVHTRFFTELLTSNVLSHL
jgi:hypothetical protein